MKSLFDLPYITPDYYSLTTEELRLLLVQKEIESQSTLNTIITQKNSIIAARERRILILEEMLRLSRVRQYAAKSEQLPNQLSLFDEAELEVAIEELVEQLPEKEPAKPRAEKRQRGFSEHLVRERITLCLTEEEKAGAQRTFFTKVKEELDYIPARMVVLEFWQEKAVFVDTVTGQQSITAAQRPIHPLGKCYASVHLLTYILVSKYADGLPLYRLEGMFKRWQASVSRTNMANWIIGLEKVFQPLLNLMREVQNSSHYLQADETRIQVLKEEGKTAQSKSWMWVIRGGPPGKMVVMFHYHPSRAGSVPEHLLSDFRGILQCDGYSGYAPICKANDIERIGCWDHARRKFAEAVKAADPKTGQSKKNHKPTKADVALAKINQLYRIEAKIQDLSDDEKYQVRQQLSVPVLNELKIWLDKNVSKVMKGSLTRKAMEYTLNQWDSLIGYCKKGYLHISNVLAENAIRPFAVGRKAWLFADTVRGAAASAAAYSLIETAKANGLEPYAYLQYVLTHIGAADTLEKCEALLPWNVTLEAFSKNVSQFG